MSSETAVISHCMQCDKPDEADNLVQCDGCNGYVHYGCAEVGESIADPDRSFVCKGCNERSESLTIRSRGSSRQGSRTSKSSARLELAMAKLEREKQRRLQELDDEERLLRKRREVEIEIERMQFEMLEAELPEEDDRSVRSVVSSRAVKEYTAKWVKGNCEKDAEIQAAIPLEEKETAARSQQKERILDQLSDLSAAQQNETSRHDDARGDAVARRPTVHRFSNIAISSKVGLENKYNHTSTPVQADPGMKIISSSRSFPNHIGKQCSQGKSTQPLTIVPSTKGTFEQN